MADEMYHVPGASGDPAEGLSSKQYSVNYLKALYGRQGAWKYLRNFTADIAAAGESVTVPSFPKLTAGNVSFTDGTYSADATAIDPQTILINKAKQVSFKVPRMTYLQSKLNVQSAFAEAAAAAVSVAFDSELIGLIAGLSNTSGSLGADLDEGKLNGAVQALVGNGVLLDNPDDFVWVLPFTQYSAVKALKGYESYRIMASETDANGTHDVQMNMQTLLGSPVFFKNDAQMTVTGGKIGGLFYKDSVGIAIQRAPALEPPVRVPGSVNIELLTWTLFGIKAIKPLVACKILCK